jgi:hypothetical protein
VSAVHWLSAQGDGEALSGAARGRLGRRSVQRMRKETMKERSRYEVAVVIDPSAVFEWRRGKILDRLTAARQNSGAWRGTSG